MSMTTSTPRLAVARWTSSTKSCVAVIDRRIGPELQRPGAFLVASAGDDDLEPEQVGERDRHRPDAAGPAMDQHPVAVGREPALEQIDPDGEQGLGHRRRLGHPHALRGPSGRCPPARRNIRHSRRPRPSAQTFWPISASRLASATTVPAISSPRMSRRARRRRIKAAALEDVGAVDPRRGDLDQHLARARARAPAARPARARPTRRRRPRASSWEVHPPCGRTY